jgi:hypothetical protein
MYFSTDLTQDGEQLVRYYRSRFQIEFLYRDEKQLAINLNLTKKSKTPRKTLRLRIDRYLNILIFITNY